MIKNEILIGTVQGLGFEGEGIIKVEDYVVFVPFALVGETIKYKVLKVQKNVVFGKLLEVLSSSEDRIVPSCKFFGKCGGCQLQHLEYEKQLEFKRKKIEECFYKIAGLKVAVEKAIAGDNCFHYRNNLQLPIANVKGKNAIGFYAKNSHNVIEIDDCVINPTWTSKIISVFNEYFNDNKILGYDEEKHLGDVREITVKEASNKLLITVVTLKDQLKNYNDLINRLKSTLECEFSLYINVNSKRTNVIYGDSFRLLYGQPNIDSEMHGIKYKVGVRSFMQVNDSVCYKLYDTVIKTICADEKTTVIDSYSGAGLMTAMLARSANKAIGIEIIPEAVQLANELASNNGLSQKTINYLGKCEDILPDIITKEKKINDKISLVIDPPRKGCDKKVIDAIIKSEIDKIVYVSCNPSTLARDVGLLIGTLEEKDGKIIKTEKLPRYNIEFIRPFDIFCQTKHIETLIYLTKI